MMWILVWATLLDLALGSLVIITERVSVCSAVYTTGTESVTVVQSTVAVSSTPWSDSAANSGTPFVIQVSSPPPTKGKGDAAITWLTADGNTTTDSTRAAQYQINNGQLSGNSGEYVSTIGGIPSQPLYLSVAIASIFTTFSVHDSILSWNNMAFPDGTAGLFKTPRGMIDNARVVARFSGPTESDWISVFLKAVPASTGQQSSDAAQSTSIATTISIGSSSATGIGSYGGGSYTQFSSNSSVSAMSLSALSSPSSTSPLGPAQYTESTSPGSTSVTLATFTTGPLGPIGKPSGYETTDYSTSFSMGLSIPSSYTPSSTSMSSSSTMKSYSSSKTSTSASSRDTQAVSPNGHCGTFGNGGTSNGYTCTGSAFGQCCSYSGFCGNNTDYCLDGCQSKYGSCITQTEYPITSNGDCGSNEDNQTCAGGISGPCCGVDGSCGSSNDFCGAGNCNPKFGACSGLPSSSSMTSSMMSTSMPSGPPIYGGSTSSSISSAMSTSSSSTMAPPPYSSRTSSTSSMAPPPYGSQTSSFTSSPSSSSMMSSSSLSSMTRSSSSSSMPTSSSSTVNSSSSSSSLGGSVSYGSSTSTSSMQPSSSMASYSSSRSSMVEPTSYGAYTTSSSYMMTSSPSSSSMMASSSSSSSITDSPLSSSSSSSSTSSSISSKTVLTSTSSSMPISSSNSSSSSFSSMSSSSNSTMGSSSFKTSSTSYSQYAPASTPTYSCPGLNKATVADQYGEQYTVQCGADTTSNSYDNGGAVNSWNDCFSICYQRTQQSQNQCIGWTYVGGKNGFGAGTCFLKGVAPMSFVSLPVGTDPTIYVAAILAADYNAAGDSYPPPGMYSSSSMASSSLVIMSSSSSFGPSRSATSSVSVLRTTTITTTTTTTSSRATTTTTTTTASIPITTTTATTTTTTSKPSSSTSSTSTSKYLALPSPTPCDFGDPVGTDEDDSYCEIPLPFSMQIYSKTDTTAHASTNGYISILSGASQYNTGILPSSHIPNNTVAPYMADLYVYGGAHYTQGIFYQLNSTGVTFEYYLGRYQAPASQIYHFTVSYDTSSPGVFVYTYYAAGGSADDGLNGVVGVQGIPASGSKVGFTYSANSADILPGLIVTCDTTKASQNCVTTRAGSGSKR